MGIEVVEEEASLYHRLGIPCSMYYAAIDISTANSFINTSYRIQTNFGVQICTLIDFK
jgi:hypothetical protein